MSLNDFIKETQLDSKIKLNNGTFDVPVNLFEETVLEPLKIKPKTYKELTERTNQFHAGIVQVAGQQATEEFKNKPDTFEIGVNYDNHGLWNHSTVFSRGTGDNPSNVVTTVDHPNSALNEVQNALIEEFNNLDN